MSLPAIPLLDPKSQLAPERVHERDPARRVNARRNPNSGIATSIVVLACARCSWYAHRARVFSFASPSSLEAIMLAPKTATIQIMVILLCTVCPTPVRAQLPTANPPVQQKGAWALDLLGLLGD